nr:MAG: MC055R [Molluscum contagiosum virus]
MRDRLLLTIVSVLGTRALRPCCHPGSVSSQWPDRYSTSTFDAVGRCRRRPKWQSVCKERISMGNSAPLRSIVCTPVLSGACLWRAAAGYGDKSAWLSSCFPLRTQRILVFHRESFACEPGNACFGCEATGQRCSSVRQRAHLVKFP